MLSLDDRFNKRANAWNSEGYDAFKKASFTYCLNDDCFSPELVEKASGDYYPVGDACDKDTDPKEGCVKTSVAYFSHSVKEVKDEVSLSLLNELDIVIANATIKVPSKSFLKSVCFRVRNTAAGYVLDVPPEWKLRMNQNDTGCSFGNGWDPVEFSKKSVESVAFQVEVARWAER